MIRHPVPVIALALTTVLLVLGFVLSWHYYARMNPYIDILPDGQSSGIMPIELNNVEVRTRAGGTPQWQVFASSLTVSPDRRTLSATGLSNGVFFRNGAPSLLFTAKHLMYALQAFSLRSNFELDGGIELQTLSSNGIIASPVRITTPAVYWNGSSGTAICPAIVHFAVESLGEGSAEGLSFDTLHKLLRFTGISATTAGSTDTDSAPAGSSQPPAASAAPPPESNLVTYAATKSGYWDENNRVLTLQGQVTFQQGKAEVTMNGAAYDRKTNIATSDSPVTITDTDTTVNGDHGSINFTTHVAILSGHIHMIVLPKPGDVVKEQDAKKPTTILCDQINYDYRAKQAQTTGTVVIQQPDRTVTADDGKYDVTLKVVNLVGNVIGKSTDGKVIRAPNAKVSVDPNDEWIELTGPVTGQLPLADDDNPLADGKSSDAKSQAKPGVVKESAAKSGVLGSQ